MFWKVFPKNRKETDLREAATTWNRNKGKEELDHKLQEHEAKDFVVDINPKTIQNGWYNHQCTEPGASS